MESYVPTPYSRPYYIGIPNPRNPPNLDMVEGGRNKDYFEYGASLYEASIQGDWKAAESILFKNPELVRYGITEYGETALHVAAYANRSIKVLEFVKNLVDKMSEGDLEFVNKNHNTALYLAAATGNLEMVKILAEKNEVLLEIPGHHGTMMPVYAAAMFGADEVVSYLYSKSRQGLDGVGWTDETRGWLLEKCVESCMFDIALDIVKRYPDLGRRSRVLGVLARKPKAFSETESSFIKRTIYS
ncbi:ankyrin repeat-containing domain, PGG domain protein, partial [Tanacetum coccineum]